MAYEINEAKELVVEAGKKLVECGLIARTWGNVSARISDTQFVITPSGRAYETLTPEEIVVVNIEDCEYEGDIKPSSEKGVHADAYRLRPDVNFVIHTHQVNASVMSPLSTGVKKVPAKYAQIIGERVPCGDYGMPSTGKLRKGVAKAVKKYKKSKAVIMKHHGALCMGADFDEAFNIADALEKVCDLEIQKVYAGAAGKSKIKAEGQREIFLAKAKTDTDVMKDAEDLGSSKRIGGMFTLTMKDGTEYSCEVDTGICPTGIVPRVALIHSAIYKNSSATFIGHYDNPDVVAVSKLGKELHPYLDDFSQIAGKTVKCMPWERNNQRNDAPEIAKALKGRSAVLVTGKGALCIGTSESDVHAVELVLDKECKTQMFNTVAIGGEPISALDCLIMRTIYVTKYSKKASEK